MSRVGKKPIQIPKDVEVKIEENKVMVKGPKGTLVLDVPSEIRVEIKKDMIFVFPQKMTKQTKALWGSTRALLANNIEGVINGFVRKLELEGIGYRASIEGKDLVLNIGFTHPVKITVPEDINFSVERNLITVSGIDKQRVSQLAAQIRKVRPPEPYKGKGIRYAGEIVKRKVGKKAVATGK